MRKIQIPITVFLIVLNCICFVAATLAGVNVWELFGKGPDAYGDGEWYRVFTAIFCHGSVSHLGSNMIALYGVGQFLERARGWKRFLFDYFVCGIVGGMLADILNIMLGRSVISVGASGAIFGLVGVFIVMCFNGWFYQISVKQVVAFLLLSVIDGVSEPNVDFMGHVGGFVVGLIIGFVIVSSNRRNRNQNR